MNENDLVAAVRTLPLERMVELTAGSDLWHTVALSELGLRAARVTDGPNGARGHVFDGEPSTCFPVGTALASTWDVDLVREVGRALAAETLAKDARVLLAPTVNLHRHPLAGRNFEAFSEEPFLSSQLAVAYISGVQDLGVGACVKHFVGNESEYQRHSMSSDVDERTLHEVYLRPFRAAVDAGVWAVMAAYNRLNGIAASDHRQLLTSVLRDEWGFDGIVMSDWGGTRSTIASIEAGLDLEMPGPPRRRGADLVEAVANGQVSRETVERSAVRVAEFIERCNRPLPENTEPIEPDDVADEAALRSMVLLRNNGVLPLAGGSLAVVGPNADPGQIQGGGSSRVVPRRQVTPVEGLRDHGRVVSVVHEPGCRIDKYARALDARRTTAPSGEPGALLELFESTSLEGAPVESRVVRSLSQRFYGEIPSLRDSRTFGARLTATFVADVTGSHRVGLATSGTATMRIDGRPVLEASSHHGTGDTFYGWGTDEHVAEIILDEGQTVEVVVEYARDNDASIGGVMVGLSPPDPVDAFERAVEAARAADVAVVVVGLDGVWETEGNDRESLALPGRQDELVHAVASVNPSTVVVLNTGSPVVMPWLDDVAAVLWAPYPGQGFGTALATLLLGDEDPSGRLPTTFPRRIEDTPAFPNYPGVDGHVSYAEGLHLGHRHYDKHAIEPAFCFGHGLSYTTFEIGEPTVDPSDGHRLHISLPVRNTGDRTGSTLVQLYVSRPNSDVDRPVKELAGFSRIRLAAGEVGTMAFALSADDLKHWDPTTGGWTVEPGLVRLMLGTSSRSINAALEVHLDDDDVFEVPE